MGKYSNGIFISSEELKIIRKKIIGSGTEANVYDAGNGILYKIYHHNISLTTFYRNDFVDEDGVRVYNKKDRLGNANTVKEKVEYIDSDGVRLHSDTAVIKASLKQANVFNTDLPLGPIYVDGHFRGCALKYEKYNFQLHKIFGFLPKYYRLILLKQLLVNIQELYDNYIYHVDLDNKPTFSNNLSHSNVLVGFNGINIIDLDGKSTIYREYEDDLYYRYSLRSLNTLLLDLVFNIDLVEAGDSEDIFYYEDILDKYGMPKELMSGLLSTSLDIEMLNDVVKIYEKK